jgi:aspartyl aminopeptidase
MGGYLLKNMPKKINYQKLEKELVNIKKSCWEIWNASASSAQVIKDCFEFSEGYKAFLNMAKTERETVASALKLAEKNGYKNIQNGKDLKSGDKIYAVNRDKNLVLARIGRKNISEGIKIIMSHIDSPHLDLKVNPLYEDEGIGFFKTHYYGGIKKYQWPTIALALHGVVYLKNGKKVDITIGEKDSDPVFMITDLLPHLDRDGGPGTTIKGREVLGEDLNLVIGSIPVADAKVKEKVKLAMLEYLNKEYGIVEEDLSSAELSAVPSEKARDLGFDRSLISAYGHDDKVCAYSSLLALFESKQTDETQMIIFVDREEIGSDGMTGAKSNFLEILFSDILKKKKEGNGSLDDIYRIFAKSSAISADVTAALDPDYKEVHDPRNCTRLGFGLAIERYTGSGGKYSTSEASGEYIRKLRAIFASNKNIAYQFTGGLGKVDKGGGGTIAKYLANKNIEVVDMGVPLFNMHAPLEIASKADLYTAYLGYRAFFEK